MADIEKILKKKKWTPKEIGQVLLANTAHIYDYTYNRDNCDGFVEALITPEKMAEMRNSIKNFAEYEEFLNYDVINNWIVQKIEACNSTYYYTAFTLQILKGYITEIIATENAFEYKRQLPIIMTKKEYHMISGGSEGYLEFLMKNQRALDNGIAIIESNNSPNTTNCIDENSYFKEPKINQFAAFKSLDMFIDNRSDSKDFEEQISELIGTFEDYYYYLQGFNKQIDLTVDLTGLSELEVLKRDREIKVLEDMIDGINELISSLLLQIMDTKFIDEGLARHKIKIIKKIFPHMEYTNLTTPEKNIDIAKKMVNDFSAYGKHRTEFDQLVCYHDFEPTKIEQWIRIKRWNNEEGQS